MIAYFSAAAEGRRVMPEYPKLLAWWQAMQRRQSLAATDPGLPARIAD